MRRTTERNDERILQSDIFDREGVRAPRADHGTWDERYVQVLAVFNAGPQPFSAPFPDGGEWYKLHPALAALGDPGVDACSADNATRRLTVSPRMAAVFVQER
jgi:hypothetical protein